MGQIVFNGQKPKYCNLSAITTGNHATDVPKAGEVWLIDSTNSLDKPDGTGKYDKYIVGDNSHTASQLANNPATLFSIDNAQAIDIDDTPTSGSDHAVSSGGVYQSLDGKADKSDVYTKSETYTKAEVNAAITTGSGTIDNALDSASNNAVKNKVIKAAIDNKQDRITTVTVNVDSNTGTPSGTATFNNNTLELSFSNLKGAKGDTGSAGVQGIQGATGPQGPKGDTGATGDTASLIMVQEVDETTPYTAATDVAGAAAAQKLMLDGIDDEEVIARALVELKSYQEDGYAFKGIVAENTSVGEQIQKAAYIATPGTYRQFGDTNLVVPEDYFGIIAWNGSAWSLTTYPMFTQEVTITDFSSWTSGYKDTAGVIITTSPERWQHGYVKVLAGQTITIKSCGAGNNITITYLANTDGTILCSGLTNTNVSGTYTYTSPKTQYYYVCVRTYNTPGENTLIAPSVTLSSVGTKNIKKENVVDFGKGESWNDVVSALALKDKNILTEEDGEWINGVMNKTHPASGNGSLYKFTNDGYSYIYAKVKHVGDSDDWAFAMYSGEPSNSTLIKRLLYESGPMQYRPDKEGDWYIIKEFIPEDCRYIYINGGIGIGINNRRTKVWIFKDTSLIPFRMLIDNFTLESGTTIFDKTYDAMSVYSNYNDYVNIRNNFGKESGFPFSSATPADFRCIFVSDIHADTNAFERIVNLTNRWNSEGYVDAMILTGDIADNLPTEDYTWFHNFRAKCNVDILSTPGNHDWNYTVTGNQERTYNNIIAPMVDGITVDDAVKGKVDNIVQPSDASTNFRLYYYKDYGNIRFIGIYTSVDSAVQLTWLEEVLADAITNNKAVIIGNHSPFDDGIAPYKYNSVNAFYEASPNTFMSIDGTFHNTSVSQLGSDTPINSSYVAAVKTFMDNGGTFICWMSGHTHRDHFYDVSQHDTYGYQLMLNTNGAVTTSGGGDMLRLGAAGNRDCYNYVTVNTTQKLLKVLRIGCNVDAIGRGRTVFVYDYVNHKIVVNY